MTSVLRTQKTPMWGHTRRFLAINPAIKDYVERPTDSLFMNVLVFAFLIAASVPVAVAATLVTTRPNVVIIVADDLGWGDVGWHGSSIRTPNLDRLATEGIELDQHYVSPMCTPTRAALLSGRYASRFGVTTFLNEPAYFPETVTVAEVLRDVGYTTALTGKWHLGSKVEWGPNLYGFDHAYGSLAGAVTPWEHRYAIGEYSHTWRRNGELIDEEGHVTDLITREAVRWIESRDNRPFFLYVPYTAPHVPVEEEEKWTSQYSDVTPVSRRHYAASVSHMDWGVGQILDALDRKGKRGNTLVAFFSDNGANPDVENNKPSFPGNFPDGPAGGSNLPLRGNKHDVLEGGIRVPAVVSWPGRLRQGRFETPIHAVDWMPTLCALAGATPKSDLNWDGSNIWPALTGTATLTARPLYWAGPDYSEAAVRDGDWKLILDRESSLSSLFNLASDPFEKHDLAAEEPSRVEHLQKLLFEMAAADIPSRSEGDSMIFGVDSKSDRDR